MKLYNSLEMIITYKWIIFIFEDELDSKSLEINKVKDLEILILYVFDFIYLYQM